MGELCAAGCCPHDGSGSAAEGCPPDPPDAPLTERIVHLYVCQLLSTYRIAQTTGDDRQRVGRMLRKAGITVKPRGAGRSKRGRDDQARRLDQLMADLYLHLRLSSTQIAELVGTSLVQCATGCTPAACRYEPVAGATGRTGS
jgi:hypothetical protein